MPADRALSLTRQDLRAPAKTGPLRGILQAAPRTDLRLVSEGRRHVAQLDAEAVEALRKDGFVVLEGDRVELAN
jgi:hypothetical protein